MEVIWFGENGAAYGEVRVRACHNASQLRFFFFSNAGSSSIVALARHGSSNGAVWLFLANLGVANIQYAFSLAAKQALFRICSSGTVSPGMGGASCSWLFCGVLDGCGDVAREEPGRGERSMAVLGNDALR